MAATPDLKTGSIQTRLDVFCYTNDLSGFSHPLLSEPSSGRGCEVCLYDVITQSVTLIVGLSLT